MQVLLFLLPGQGVWFHAREAPDMVPVPDTGIYKRQGAYAPPA